MSRKVFITVLGASFYGKAYYKTETFRSSLTPFIQSATLELINAKNWSADDAAYVLLTKKAEEENWNKTIRERSKHPGGPLFPYVGLEQVLEDMQLPFKVTPRPILDGNNEQEIWENFDRVFSVLNEGDELYFDLTHGFRYLPMLVLVLGNYAKFIHNCKVVHISYGNYEAGIEVKGEKDVKDCDFVDLLSLSNLQDWTDAVELFNYTGNTTKIRKIITDTLSVIKGPNLQRKEMESICNPLEDVSLDLKTCQGKTTIEGKNLRRLFGKIDSIKPENLSKPFKPLIKKIRTDFAEFSATESWRNGIVAARWCFDRQQYQQAITFLQESLNTYLCVVLGLDWRNKDHREFASGDVMHWGNKLHRNAGGNINNARDLLSEGWKMNDEVAPYVRFMVSNDSLFTLFDLYQKITQPRNGYNHCHMTDDKGKNVKNNIEDRLSDVETWMQNSHPLEEGSCGSVVIDSINTCLSEIENWMPKESIQPMSTPLFVNISNHPSTTWSDKQKMAAQAYGDIVDIVFPDVPPTLNEKKLQDLKKQVIDQLKQVAPIPLSTTVHVMGEMTLTYALVSTMKQMGYTCVASTSQRIATENADGSKTSVFQFEKFRQYL